MVSAPWVADQTLTLFINVLADLRSEVAKGSDSATRPEDASRPAATSAGLTTRTAESAWPVRTVAGAALLPDLTSATVVFGATMRTDLWLNREVLCDLAQ